MKKYKLLLILLIVSNYAIAQSVNYYFEQFTHNYSELSNPISINNGEVWDDPEYTISLGFDFSILGNQTNSLIIGGGELSNTTLNNLIIATAADLSDRAYNTNNNSLSPISYQIEGEAGKEICKIEWKNAGFYEDDEGVYYTNLQIWIYEESNMIEIHHGSTNIDATFYLWEEDFSGILDIDWETETGTGYMLEEIEGEYQFGYQNLDDFYESNTFTNYPEEGSVFRFYPENAIGINGLETTNLEIHPNPTSDFLTVLNESNSEIKYKIISLDGRMLQQGISPKQNTQIDLRELKLGMYFIQGIQEGVFFNKSFIKN